MNELDAFAEYEDPADDEDLAEFIGCRPEEIESTLYVGEVGVSDVMAVATSDEVYSVRVVNPGGSMAQYNRGRDSDIDCAIESFAETLGDQYDTEW